ncbi:MAG TPA: hypothetical protein DEA08_05895, partial [Planctomycetes bacterium]|nr:hypothetical protein [Planctomycetota bacterium]
PPPPPAPLPQLRPPPQVPQPPTPPAALAPQPPAPPAPPRPPKPPAPPRPREDDDPIERTLLHEELDAPPPADDDPIERTLLHEELDAPPPAPAADDDPIERTLLHEELDAPSEVEDPIERTMILEAPDTPPAPAADDDPIERTMLHEELDPPPAEASPDRTLAYEDGPIPPPPSDEELFDPNGLTAPIRNPFQQGGGEDALQTMKIPPAPPSAPPPPQPPQPLGQDALSTMPIPQPDLTRSEVTQLDGGDETRFDVTPLGGYDDPFGSQVRQKPSSGAHGRMPDPTPASQPTPKPRRALGDTMADPARERDLSGQLLNNRYKILDKLGQGGMGQVYRAEHTLMGRTVAVKVLNPELVKSDESIARFKREILAMAQFQHVNVVRVFDAGTTEQGRFYMAMEYVEGVNLAGVLRQNGPLPLDRFTNLFAQALSGVGKGHELGIVHRDLKTENILVTSPRPDNEVVKIMDFGIAKLLGGESEPTPQSHSNMFLTTERVAVGTPEYMSPEQASGGAQVDHRSDLYSLGVVAFELLTGRLPFEAESPVGFIGKHIVDPPFTFEEARPGLGLPAAIEAWVMKALEKDPDDRYQSAEEMLDALEEAAPSPELKAKVQEIRAKGGATASQVIKAKRATTAGAPAVTDQTMLVAPPSDLLSPRVSPAAGQAAGAREGGDDDLIVKLLKAAIGLAAVLALCVGVAVVYKKVLRRPPLSEALAAAELQQDLDAGRFEQAQAKLAELRVQDSDAEALAAERERVDACALAFKALEQARQDLAAARERFANLRQSNREDALTLFREKLAPAHAAATQAHAKLGTELGLSELAGEPPTSLEAEQRSFDLLNALHQAKGLLSSGDPVLVLQKLEKAEALAPAEGPERVEIARLRGEAGVRKHLLAIDKELKKAPGQSQLDEAEELLAEARKLVREHRLIHLDDEVQLAQRRLLDVKRLAENRATRAQIDADLQRAREAMEAGRFDEALSALDAADDAAIKQQIPDTGGVRAALRKRLETFQASHAEFEARPSYDERSPLATLQRALEARQTYLAQFKGEAYRREVVLEEVKELRERIAQASSAKQQQELDRRLAAAKAKGEQNPQEGLRALKEVLAYAKEQELDSAPVEAAIAALEEAAKRSPVPAAELTRRGFVRLSDKLWIGRHELTNSEYSRFIANMRRDKKSLRPLWPSTWEVIKGTTTRIYPSGKSGFPLRGVSFQQAEAYCRWASEDLAEKLPGLKRVRLPSEAEWMRAARGETQRAYPWGDKWDPKRCVCKRGEQGSPLAVTAGTKLSGETPETKLRHMAGNVAEWVDTVWEDDDGTPDPSRRILKGGSFASVFEQQLKVDARVKGGTQESKPQWGFRVVIELK